MSTIGFEEVSVFFPKRFHRHADTYFVWSFKTWFSPRFCLLLKYLCDKSRICTRTSLQSPKSRTSTFSILVRLDFYQYLLISVVLLANSAFKTLKILIQHPQTFFMPFHLIFNVNIKTEPLGKIDNKRKANIYSLRAQLQVNNKMYYEESSSIFRRNCD